MAIPEGDQGIRPHVQGRRRIAIIHFSGPPAPGGIETLIDAQARALGEWGHSCRVIVGSGAGPIGIETTIIPELDPQHPKIQQSLMQHRMDRRCADLPLVGRIADALEAALQGCNACWVHNAFTVQLNPPLTMALERLVFARADIEWTAWTSDISSLSRFVTSCPEPVTATAKRLRERVRWLTVSRTRRGELAQLLDLPQETIPVISPPVDPALWARLAEESVETLRSLGAGSFDFLVLTAAKLLPHKGLDMVVDVADALVASGVRPLLVVTAAASPHEGSISDRVGRELNRSITAAGMEGHVGLLADIVHRMPDSRLVRDMTAAADLIFLPSHEEGFGLPILEAAALGVPIVCRDIAPFREVAGDAATYFRADESPGDIAGSILRVAMEPRALLRRRALRSWDRFRDDLLSVV